MRHYFLGMAAEYTDGRWFKHLMTFGWKKDLDALTRFLAQKYKGEAMLCKNGRSALALALKAYFEPGDAILVNAFTCYAVYEAIIKAGLKPIFVDISKDDLNFTTNSLEQAIRTGPILAFSPTSSSSVGGPQARPPVRAKVSGIIIQNTLGNPVNIKSIEKFAKEHELAIIEDLAHSAGVRYSDKREAGTVGVATVLSFGKDKSIDTISGGALVLRDPCKHEIKAPFKTPKISDHLRAKFYPMFGALCRSLTYVGLGGGLMRLLAKIHWVEKSADNRLSLDERPSKFEAKLALRQMKELRKTGEPALRDFCFVRDREELLGKLRKNGYYFSGFWYEKPVSPMRYYKKVHFPEKECPNAVYAAGHIINIPSYYTRRDLSKALDIIKEYREEGEDGRE